MSLLDVISAPWAILPDKLGEIHAIYERHARGEKADLSAIEARLGKTLDNKPTPLTVTNDGVAIITMNGVMGKRANLFAEISGGVSTQLVERDVKTALADPNVKAILLESDSPGGAVDGTQQLAAAIRAAAAIKPMATYTDGTLASAAFWAGSATGHIYAQAATNNVGSIGVWAKHYDQSKAQDQRGIKVTDITAGKFKAVASENAPLSDDGRSVLQAMVDGVYAEFVRDIEANLGKPDGYATQNNWADGRVFSAREAARIGLISGIASRDEVIAKLLARVPTAQKQASIVNPRIFVTGARMSQDNTTGAPSLPSSADAATVAQHFPQAAAALRSEGASAERERIAAVEAQSLPGHEALIAQLKTDGKTTGPEAAIAVLNAHKAQLGAQATTIKTSRIAPLAQGALDAEPEAKAQPTDRNALHLAAVAIQKARGISYTEAVKAAQTQGA